jgi:glycosyltransferase 2 family protein
MKKILLFLLKIGVSFLLLFFLFQRIDISKILGVAAGFRKSYFFYSAIVFFSAYVFAIIRWGMLLSMAQVKYSLKRLIIVSFGSNFFTLIFPSTIGADIVRSLDLGVHTNNLKAVTATVFIDRLSGYIALVIIALVSLLFSYRYIHNPLIYIIIGLLVLVSIFLLLLLFNENVFNRASSFFKNKGKINEKIEIVYREIFLFRKYPKLLILNLIISILIQLALPLTCWFLILGLDKQVQLAAILVIIPVITLISSIPITIGGLGIREWSSGIFLTQIGLTQEIGVTLSLVQFFFMAVVSVAGGIVYVLTFRSRRL